MEGHQLRFDQENLAQDITSAPAFAHRIDPIQAQVRCLLDQQAEVYLCPDFASNNGFFGESELERSLRCARDQTVTDYSGLIN